MPLGRILSLALAVVNLLVLPFGTALGVYALWVLLTNDGPEAVRATAAVAGRPTIRSHYASHARPRRSSQRASRRRRSRSAPRHRVARLRQGRRRSTGDRVSFTIELTTPACPVKEQMREQATAAVRALPGVGVVDVQMTAKVRSASAPETGRPPLPGVKNVIAVGAGKGGVGKTTVAVNLALALARCGSRVGILDGDIYGPNVPIMMGLTTQLTTDEQRQIVPAEKYGVQVISIGFMTNDDDADHLAGADACTAPSSSSSARSPGRTWTT